MTRMFLYVDNNVTYEIVDKIKTEIASINAYNIIYKTNSIEDKDILKGLFFRNHHSFFKIAGLKKQITKRQEEENERFNDSIKKLHKLNGFGMLPPPPPPPPHWSYDFKQRLYSDKQDVIDEVLSEKRSTCITLTNDGIVLSIETLGFENVDDIEDLFKANEVLIVKLDRNLDYKNYFKMMKIVKEVESKNKGSKFALWVELSSEIRKIHKKAGVNIFD